MEEDKIYELYAKCYIERIDSNFYGVGFDWIDEIKNYIISFEENVQSNYIEFYNNEILNPNYKKRFKAIIEYLDKESADYSKYENMDCVIDDEEFIMKLNEYRIIKNQYIKISK